MSKKRSTSSSHIISWRVKLLMVMVTLTFIALTARAAFLQVIDPDFLRSQSDLRSLVDEQLPVQRGLITDRNGTELAVSVPVKTVYADPKNVAQGIDRLQQKAARRNENYQYDEDKRWQALAQAIEMQESELKDKLLSDPHRRFIYLKRQISPNLADYISGLNLPGIYLSTDSKRYYPTGEISAHIVGYTDLDGKGIDGAERLYNDALQGTAGSRKVRRDKKGFEVEVLEEQQQVLPKDITLSIDQRIQAVAYRALKSAVLSFKAASGSVVVVDVTTGEILAMVNSPSFNPNNRENVATHRFKNRAISDSFEPGSTVKPLAVVAALEHGSYGVHDLVDTSPGYMRLGGQMVKDLRNLGAIDMATILQKSSNMGVTKLALSVSTDEMISIYERMGLTSTTGTGLVGETDGIFPHKKRWSDFERATLSFGYSIAVSSMQLARMYSILGAGGVSRPLSIVKRDEVPVGEQVIDHNTAVQVLGMMETVLEAGGTGRKARVPGYRIAGKTGTARKAFKGGYGDDYVNSFAGVGPISNPRIATIVMINEPGTDYYHGGDTAAPVFAEVMQEAFRVLNIAPDEPGFSYNGHGGKQIAK